MIRIFRQYLSLRKMVFVAGEGLLIFVAIGISSFFILGGDVGFAKVIGRIWPKAFVIVFLTQTILYFNDLYEFHNTEDGVEFSIRLMRSIGIISVLLAVLYGFWPMMNIGRWIFFGSLVLLLIFLVSWRFLYVFLVKRKVMAEDAILLGCGDLAREIMHEIQNRKDVSYNIRCIIAADEQDFNSCTFEAVPVSNGLNSVSDLAMKKGIGTIIVALDQNRGMLPQQELLQCKTRGINIIDGQSFYERITGKLCIERIHPSWLIFSDGFVKSRVLSAGKRLTDLIASACLLILLAPVWMLAALAVKLDSPGPVLFKQQRVGEFGKIFTLYKLRTMVANAEKESGPIWATEHDSRITRVGNILRKTRIDEIPQVWNVFKGDMSFIGPRPERPFFVERLKKIIPYYDERYCVRPGITGWAQVKYAYSASEEESLEKVKYDLYYIKNMSLVMDLIIIFHTVKIALLGRGAR